MNNKLLLFETKEIRKLWHNEEWYFSIVDIIEVLTESPLPRQYWNKVKKNLITESQSYPFWIQLKLTSNDGKNYKTDCSNTEGVFRIIMTVPSPRAEPLKRWLSEQGKRAIDETENPELLTQRQIELYKAKGYTNEWIERRMKGISVRKELTDEWKKRDVQEGQEFSILTATIAKGTFGLTPSEHTNLKGLEKENLRDHMTPLELILTALGEEVTRTLAIKDNAVGFNENLEAAAKGGEAGGRARRNVEEITGEKVVSSENFLKQIKKNVEELPPSV